MHFPLGFIRNTKVFPLGFIKLTAIFRLGFIKYTTEPTPLCHDPVPIPP